MNEATLLARVQAHLDAHRDPLDDGEVVAFLDAHPDALATVAALRADARALAALPVSRKRRWWLTPAAALVAAAGALIALRPGTSAGANAGRILAASLEEVRPRAHVAASYVVRQALVVTPNATLECWQLHSEPR